MDLISIVTIVKNDLDGFKLTANSIEKQTCKKFEYIVIDGGSDDGTLEEINKRKSLITFYSSKSDSGISEAFNLGIASSSNRYILMLNAGDELASSDTIEKIYSSKILSDGSDIVCGGVLCDIKGYTTPNDNFELDELPHQGMLVGRNVYRMIGGYSVSYEIRMDYEFILRAAKNRVALRYYDGVVSKYTAGGKSTIIKNRCTFYKEGLIARYHHQEYFDLGQFIRYFYWKIYLSFTN